MIGRTEAIAQADSDSLDCWVQLTLPQVALCFLRVDSVLILGENWFLWCAIEFQVMPKEDRAVETASIQTKPGWCAG